MALKVLGWERCNKQGIFNTGSIITLLNYSPNCSTDATVCSECHNDPQIIYDQQQMSAQRFKITFMTRGYVLYKALMMPDPFCIAFFIRLTLRSSL